VKLHKKTYYENMSDRFIINGLGGKKKLSGSIEVKGAKNAALKALAASILFKDGITLKNVPDIEDVKRMNDILEEIGVSVTNEKRGKYALSTPQKVKTDLPIDLAQRMRASIVLSGPLLSRFGAVSFPHPGGCVIGERPIDFFIDSFEKMGARYFYDGKQHVLKAPKKTLHGATIIFKKPSVTATETLMMAATLVYGKTILKNTAQEPEIVALAEFLNACGAKISGAGTSTIEIIGSKSLRSGRATYQTPPDRIETGSFLILAALTGKKVEIKKCDPTHLEILIETLKHAGVHIDVEKDSILVSNSTSAKFQPTDIETREYPGFPTDLQAPMTVFLTQVRGQSHVFETIFEGRLAYVSDLIRMGARVDVCDPHRIIVHGPTALFGREVKSPDLRAGLAFVIATIIAKGQSVIHNVYNIDRGYEKIEERLSNLGVNIKRV